METLPVDVLLQVFYFAIDSIYPTNVLKEWNILRVVCLHWNKTISNSRDYHDELDTANQIRLADLSLTAERSAGSFRCTHFTISDAVDYMEHAVRRLRRDLTLRERNILFIVCHNRTVQLSRVPLRSTSATECKGTINISDCNFQSRIHAYEK